MSGAWVALQVFSSAEIFPFLFSKYFHSHNEKVKLFQISQSLMSIKAAIKLLPGYTLTIVSICIHSNCCSIQLSREFEPQKSRAGYTRKEIPKIHETVTKIKVSTVRVKSFRLSVFGLFCCVAALKNRQNFCCVGQPQAMCQCWHLPCSTRTAQHKPHKAKPNRRRQGNPPQREPATLSYPLYQLSIPPLPTLPHSHFKLELCVVNILRLQHQTLQITHAWQRGKWLRGRRGMVYRKRKWTLTSAGCRHEIDKWAAASCHAPRHSDDRGPTAKVCE